MSTKPKKQEKKPEAIIQTRRIETLQKKKTTTYAKQRGIPVAFADFPIRINVDTMKLSDHKLAIHVETEIAKQMNKALSPFHKHEQVRKYMDQLFPNGLKRLKIVDFSKVEDAKYAAHLRNFLGGMRKSKKEESEPLPLKLLYYPLPHQYKHYKVPEGKDHIIAYTAANYQLADKYHGAQWRRGYTYNYDWFFNFTALLSRWFVEETVKQFIKNNMETMKYVVAAHMLYVHPITNGELPLPSDPVYAEKLENFYRQHFLFDTPFTKKEDPHFTRYAPLFKEEEGWEQDSHLYYFGLRELLKQADHVHVKIKRESDQASDYALSFQTKKHINESTMKAMKRSVFLEHYQYVELDNNVELKEFYEIERELVRLRKLIWFPVAKDHDFRVKRLGRHRAAGLYYPDPIRCTIIDVKKPRSLMHEVGHQIDHTVNKDRMVSETLAFRPLYDLYEILTERQVADLPEEHAFKRNWKSKNKYNRSYYLQPTEVFARSYELYMWHKGIHTSLAEEHLNYPEYPHQPEFIEKVIHFFDEHIPKWETASEKPKQKASSRSKKETANSAGAAARTTKPRPTVQTVPDESKYSEQLFFDLTI